MTSDPLTCRAMAFDELDARTAYAVWRLRQDVFVVEQTCPYPDLDGRDDEPGTRHVVLTDHSDGGAVLGYARVLDDRRDGLPVWKVGRVVLTPSARGRGLADRLVTVALETCAARDAKSGAGRDVVLDAQTPLAGWYAGFGFAVDGPDFVEDGIPHTPMRLRR